VIFVTVGTQLPFDRLVCAVDAWAAARPEVGLFAQVGPGAAPPAHLPHTAFVSPARADELMRCAELIVAHAGMGSLLTAMGYGKPILIMPRRAALGEHRNDHQLATARWMAQRPGVSVAWDESQVAARLDERGALVSGASIPRFAHDTFVQRLRAEVLEGLGR
jgi:UDP-N-acetylglucosamine transferase subunit ALG13